MTLSKKDVESWDSEYVHLKWGGLAELSWISDRLPTGGFLLDAGSGEGRYLKEFCFTRSCIGVDISKTALHRSVKSLGFAAEKKAHAGFIVPDHMAADVSRLPFKSAVFDGILCLGVLQHLTARDRQKTAAEFFRILKPGGRLFFEAFGEDDMRCRGDPYPPEEPETRTFLRQNGIIYHYFEESEIKDLFENEGFLVLDVIGVKKEKKYAGEIYTRHHYRAVLEKQK